MRRTLAVALLIATTVSAQSAAPTIFGFADASKEQALESRYDAQLDRANLRTWMQRLSARPHHVGSAYGKENAEFMAGLFRSWGYETELARYDVMFPTPKTRVLELLAPETYTAKLTEPPVKEDAASQLGDMLPPYNAYSIDGDVTGELVYVNYGVPADYEVLERNGVDVRGKIAIARYGHSWRGIKPKVAAEHGAIGCIIYSDPSDDGYARGDVYPKGPYRNENGAQRGSVADMPVYPGDPTTPGVGSTANATHLDRANAQTITKIPVLPISYADALPLLRNLRGPVAPPEWRGALPITYRLGSGPAKVHLKLAFDWKLTPAYDVIARLRGSDRADEWIVRGNHHDAWVRGASDPISGLVAMLEEARSIGLLAKSGWTPRRSIVFAAWDAEEPGLLGSTEWVEDHMAELREHAAIYINSDSNGRGFLEAGGSHTLERFVSEVARDVTDPERNVSVLQRLHAFALTDATAGERKELRGESNLRLYALGSGSDYTPFLQHAGIASLNIGYGGESEGGSYHSLYDSFDHYTRFIDPTFDYGIVQAKTTGRLVLRLANADVLPFEARTLATTVGRYAKEVMDLADSMREKTEDENAMAREKTLELAADPTEPFVAPKVREAVPYLDFAPLQNAVLQLNRAAKNFDDAASPAGGAALDRAMMNLERTLTREEGLPRRPWYRHHIYAPGYYTGYGVKTLPGIREAIEQRDWKEANAQIAIAAGVIERYAKALDAAVAR
ncbi:MAG TPA: transferrin receptor-like dimerization domain-containing protein [Thermoanaerobaculia bacterium]|nr:transferrin receptor-like dimerization domain-containing protein [Thermoanaerobaculia bacterium]